MNSEAIPLLIEIRDGVAVVMSEIDALRDRLIEVEAQRDLDRRRAHDEAVKRRAQGHEIRELQNEVAMLKAIPPVKP